MALSSIIPLTYLQLCQKLFLEVGASGGTPTNAIPTTVGVTGEIQRLVGYVHDAELDIQNIWVDWKWLRKQLPFYTGTQNQTGIFTTLNGATSAFPLDLAEWDWKSFMIYPQGSTFPQPLKTTEWQEVRNFPFNVTSFTQPWQVIVMPDNTLRFDNIPDQSYQCYCEYRAVPYDLKNDGDVSNIPARFANRLIIEFARLKYGLFENAPEQVAHAKLNIYGEVNNDGIPNNQGLLAALENDQLPNRKNSRRQQGNNIVIDAGGYSSGWGPDGWGASGWDGGY